MPLVNTPHLAFPPIPQNSQLRNAVSASSSDSSSSLSSDTPESDVDGDEDDDDNWSGDTDSLDATVIAAVDGDLPLAAFLIPMLHRGRRLAAKTKVESWQYTSASGAEGSVGGDHSVSSSTADQSPSNSRKRRRQSNSRGDGGPGDEEDGDGEGDDDENPDNAGGLPGVANGPPALELACPFYKQNPGKYSTQHGPLPTGHKKDYYRSCGGPGFKSIQRLK